MGYPKRQTAPNVPQSRTAMIEQLRLAIERFNPQDELSVLRLEMLHANSLHLRSDKWPAIAKLCDEAERLLRPQRAAKVK